jgi:hypothetical protein
MWRILLGLSCLLGLLPQSGSAQQWTGTARLALTGGYQTNTYLDPVLRSWNNRSSTPGLAALTPQVGIAREARRTRLAAAARTRLYPRRTGMPQFVQGHAQARYRLSPSWSVGASGGGTRLRLGSSEESWWALPSARWAPTSNTTVTARGGLTQRYVATGQGTTVRQDNRLAMLNVASWLTDRFRTEGRVYWSDGRTNATGTAFGGTGMSASGVYWPTNQWSVEAGVGVEQVQYETRTTRTRLGRGDLKVAWHPRTAVTVFAQARASTARLVDGSSTDMHVAAGVRLRAQRVLGGTSTSPPRRRVCRAVENGVRVQVPYDGSGTPHVTGDFNGWTLPGTSLTQTDDGTWTTTLSVPSGEYAYRVRIVDGDERRWLSLPSYADTAEDAFGGTNGVCTVP